MKIPASIASRFHLVPRLSSTGNSAVRVCINLMRKVDGVHIGMFDAGDRSPQQTAGQIDRMETNCKLPLRVNPKAGEFVLYGVALRTIERLPNGVLLVKQIEKSDAFAAIKDNQFAISLYRIGLGENLSLMPVQGRERRNRYKTIRGGMKALRDAALKL